MSAFLIALALADLAFVPAAAAAPPGPVSGTLDATAGPAARIDGIPADVAQAMWQMELLRLPPSAFSLWVAHIDPNVRAHVADALGRLRDPDALIPLATLLDDPARDVRENAAFALGQTPGGNVPLGRRWSVVDWAVSGSAGRDRAGFRAGR